jgi:ribosomal protein S18 acetylase RimI-like enzyme
MLIDLDKHGTPGWLTPQGKFDNSAIRKKHRDAWLAKRRAVKDAGFDPSQPRDENGRWAYVGASSKHVDDKKLEEMRKAVYEAADMLHYPKSKLFLSDSYSVMHLNGSSYYSGAVAVASDGFMTDDKLELYNKGDIVFFVEQMKNEADVGAIAAHEIEHQRFEAILEEAFDQINGAADLHGDDVFSDAKGVNPKHKDVMPLAWKLHEGGFFGKNADLLINNDGVTPYSREYWEQFEGFPTMGTYKYAVHETLAEMAKLRYLDKNYNPAAREAPVWTELFNLIDREYRKLKNIKDAGFDPNQPRAPKGSPNGGQWTSAPGGGAKAEWIRQKIDKIADDLKFPKDRIHMSTGVHTFELNGETHVAGGLAVYSKNGYTQQDTGERFGFGDVVIFDEKDTGFNEDFPVHGVAAHEIEHQKFRQVIDRYNEQYVDLRKMGFDPFTMDLKEVENSHPTFAALHSLGWGMSNYNAKLQEDDGVTPYSQEYWEQYEADEADKSNQQLAINETLAEIAMLKVTEEARYLTPETGPKMTEWLKTYFTERYKRDGNKMSEPEEFASIMEDPWAYASDMVEKEDDAAFKKAFGMSIKNVRGLDFNGTPRFRRSFFNPEPVITPVWAKLFDTIEREYRRLNNITDAGFDPSQPRDDEGQWTETGAVKIKLGKDKLKIGSVKLRREQWASTKATLDFYKNNYNNPMNDREIVWAYEQDDHKGQLLAMLEFGPAVDASTIYLKHIRAFPQRKGIGRAAMERLQVMAAEKGLGIWLEADEHSEVPHQALVNFYKSLGFKDEPTGGLVWRPKTS